MLETYQGRCHCGAVRFEADIDFDQGTFRCNCSICRQTRFWAAIAGPDGFRLVSGEDALTEYRFNKRINVHYFCKHCGVRAFGIGNDTPIGKMHGINVGCLEGLSDADLADLPITYVDGLHDQWASPPEHFEHL